MSVYQVIGKAPNLSPSESSLCDDWLGCVFDDRLWSEARHVLAPHLFIQNGKIYRTLPAPAGQAIGNGGIEEIEQPAEMEISVG